MANLKNITDLPIIESADGVNLIVNDNGSAKQIAAGAVGAQADFNVTDENHPAFIKNKPAVVQSDWSVEDESNPAYIKNKPVEEWDLDVEIVGVFYGESCGGWMNYTHTINSINTFENIKNKIIGGVQPKCKVKVTSTGYANTDESLSYVESFDSMNAVYYPETPDGELASIYFANYGCGTSPYILLTADNVIQEIGDSY